MSFFPSRYSELLVSSQEMGGTNWAAAKSARSMRFPSACGAASPRCTIRSIFRNAKTVVLGSAIPNDDFCRLLFLGIQGFISYGEVEDRLNAAVQAVWEGHLSVPPEVLEQFAQYASRLSQLRRGGRLLFSPREKHTLRLLQQRLSNKEIGAELGISGRTVKFHLSNIFGKLGIRDRHSVTELVKSNVLLKWAAIKELSPTLSDAGPQPATDLASASRAAWKTPRPPGPTTTKFQGQPT